jgi:predicted HicB family RNase H-like nuclease
MRSATPKAPRSGKEAREMVSMIVRGIPRDLRQQVKAAAALQGKTMSAFIAEALEAAVKQARGGR